MYKQSVWCSICRNKYKIESNSRIIFYICDSCAKREPIKKITEKDRVKNEGNY